MKLFKLIALLLVIPLAFVAGCSKQSPDVKGAEKFRVHCGSNVGLNSVDMRLIERLSFQ